jgi:uncharacterized glyoxalase superfamily protein PhnB
MDPKVLAASTTPSSSRGRCRSCVSSMELPSAFRCTDSSALVGSSFASARTSLHSPEHGGSFGDPAPPIGTLSLQLAFRVAPGEVAGCAQVLAERGVKIISGPIDQPFGHRTLFFRDPDGNVLEIYAEIESPRRRRRVLPNPSLHLTAYGWLRQPPSAGELKR